MGVYDTYGRQAVQLKIGDPSLDHFKEGDEVNIADGVYLGYEGAVVIIDGKLAKVFSYVKDKWGGKIRVRDIINPINPVAQAVENYEQLRLSLPLITLDVSNGDKFATKVARSTPRPYNKKRKINLKGG
jgi:hypothetical protein